MMADLTMETLGMINPFVIASSPATHGVKAVLKSAECLPGAIAMRNFGHGAGGGSYVGESETPGKIRMQIHANGNRIKDEFGSLEVYCEGVKKARREMPESVKLWVSVGHFSDLAGPLDWESDWKKQAVELERAGADALELHFNTPGVLACNDRIFDFYRLVYKATKMIRGVSGLPVMVKLPLENCDTLRAMDAAIYGGASAVGPTARWKGFVIDLDWKRSLAEAGGGYGGEQALPVVSYVVAEARSQGISTPIYAGGGVFSWEAAAKLLMAGSDMVQLGSYACCVGPRGIAAMIGQLSAWMDQAGYPNVDSLKGAALPLFTANQETRHRRGRMIGETYRMAQVDQSLCVACGNCVQACWYEGMELKRHQKAAKTNRCIGCGYCFSACPTHALSVDAGTIAAEAMREPKP